MKNISNYSQPSFYSFNEDSLELVKFSKDLIKGDTDSLDLLDLCAGCGVIGIETKLQIKAIGKLTFLELQNEFIPFIEKNLLKSECNNFEIFQSSLGDQIFEDEKFDLIFSNPPYFLSQSGKPSSDKNRQICRFFEVDGWNTFFKKVKKWLKPEGLFFFTVRNIESVSEDLRDFDLVAKEKVAGSWLICLSRLDINRD